MISASFLQKLLFGFSLVATLSTRGMWPPAWVISGESRIAEKRTLLTKKEVLAVKKDGVGQQRA